MIKLSVEKMMKSKLDYYFSGSTLNIVLMIK